MPFPACKAVWTLLFREKWRERREKASGRERESKRKTVGDSQRGRKTKKESDV